MVRVRVLMVKKGSMRKKKINKKSKDQTTNEKKEPIKTIEEKKA
jgi:hypothetical protein